MRTLIVSVLLISTAWAGARSSSERRDVKRPGAYAASAAVDGNHGTAWVVDPESESKGAWLEIDLPEGEVDKVQIFPGYGHDAELYADFARPKKVRVEVSSVDENGTPSVVATSTVDVADKAAMQTLELPDAKIAEGGSGGRLRVTVLDVYAGQEYPTVALSEVVVVLKEHDVRVNVETVDDSSASTDALADGDPKTVWAAPGPSFRLRLARGKDGLSSLGFRAAGSDFARPKTVEISAAGTRATTVLPDRPSEIGWAAVPPFSGYTGGHILPLEVKVIDVYPGAKSQEVKIADLAGRATTQDAF